MTRREWLQAAAALAPARAAVRRPNVVLLVADDLGSGDLSSYGCPDIRTPNIDSIGARGARFTQSYSNGPECTPTRTALLTGRYQHRVGGLECAIGVGDVGRYDEAAWLQQRGDLGLPVSETTLPQMLKRAGYETACFGKWHLGYPQKFWPCRHGFDESLGILGGNADYFTHREDGGRPVLYHNDRIVERKGYITDLIAEEAIGWLKRRSANPFFLYVTFTAPHTPIQAPEEFDPKTGTAPRRQGHRPTYAKMVERMDARVGSMLAQLEAMGAAADTIVIFISDNGADPNGRNGVLRARKGTLWEGGIRIPCLMRWPGVLAEGKLINQVSLTMDIAPTLLAATGASAPAGRKLDGVNLLPVLTGKAGPFPRTVFWRSKRGENLRKAIRRGDWKLVIDNGKEELHDLAADEREQRDLLAAQPAIAREFRARLAEWEREVAAPRLGGLRAGPG
ncbi:MAG: sulfatase-like hydrolase/transferase [Acidobacteriota bacterium]